MAKDKNLIYGELSSLGVLQLIEDIKSYSKPGDLLLDIGSGYGKLVRMTAEIAGIYTMGIEIDKEKYSISQQINYTPAKDRISFQKGDIRKNKHLLDKADIIFMNNTTWSKDLTDFVFQNSKDKTIYFFSFGTTKIDKTSLVSVQVSWRKDFLTLYKTNTKLVG